jgi:hypothetical protein
MVKQGKFEISRKIPSEIRVYRQKIDKIVKLEHRYWKEIQEKKSLFKEIDADLDRKIESIFPSNVSIRIYACKNGIILLRYIEFNMPTKFQIFYSLTPLETFMNAVPIPTESGEFLIPMPLGENNHL